MKILLVEHSQNEGKKLLYLLLSLGYKGHMVENREAALSLLEEKDISAIIIDVDNKDVEGLKLIEDLSNNEKRHIPFIVHSVNSRKEFVLKMVELGCIGYLLKPIDENKSLEKLKKILSKLENHDQQRKHIRIKPDPEEMLRLHFRIPGYSKLIAGKILDLSMGGVATELFNPPQGNVLMAGVKIPSIQFSLLAKSVSAEGVIVAVKGNIIAIRFTELSSEDRMNLGRYIYNKIS